MLPIRKHHWASSGGRSSSLKSTGTTISSYGYGLNAVGNRTSAKDNGVDTINWLPDPVQQLVDDIFLSASAAFSAMRGGLDAWANLTISGWDNMILDVVGSILSGSAHLTYDDTGNRKVHRDEDTGETTTYTYDDNNRLDVTGRIVVAFMTEL